MTEPTRTRVRIVDGRHQIDRRDGRGYVDATEEEYKAVVTHATKCPFCHDDFASEHCPW